MKDFYADVTVVMKQRLRVDFRCENKPTKEEMLSILQNDEYNDVTDEETLEYQSVEEIEFIEPVDESEEDDGED